MEMTCTRCHQPVPADSCYCSACGLPQLVYQAETGSTPSPTERWPEVVRDAGSIDWKPGIRAALAMAVPAGLLSSGISPAGTFGIFWMAGAALWAVTLYLRSQRPALITVGAGARIGLVTGLIAAWLAFGVSGAGMFVTRVALHQGGQIDSAWSESVASLYQQMESQMSASADAAQQLEAQRRFMLSPEGRAGFMTMGLVLYCGLLVLLAVGGGALGARILARSHRPEV
jgi:hypothetical protein